MSAEPNSVYSAPQADRLLELLESQWLRNENPDIASYLRSDSSTDSALWHDLIELDLEYRWKRFRDGAAKADRDPHGFPQFPKLEDYAELLKDAQRHLILTPELLAEEYRVRWFWGDCPEKQDYLERLPEKSEAVSSALQQIDSELIVERATPHHEQESSQLGEESTLLIQQNPSPVTQEDLEQNQICSVGKYQLESLLGRGGFGEVWKAYDPNLGRYVAIKLPSRSKRCATEDLEHFRREAKKMATLERVPGIVPVYEAGEIDGQVYIVSYLVPGDDLGKIFKRGELSYEESVRIVAEVAETLHRAHLKNLFHRDVKLSNILIGENGDIFLSDFGLCVSETEQLKEGHSTTGTYAYMAPEQVRGFSHHLDGRADIYALGVVLYRLLTGRLPFVADTPQEYLQQVVNREPRPPRSIKDDIPPELERICLKCLQKKVTDRYTTARDLAQELREVLNEGALSTEPTHTKPDTKEALSGSSATTQAPAVPYQKRTFIGSKAGQAALVGVLALLVVILIWSPLGWPSAMFGSGGGDRDSNPTGGGSDQDPEPLATTEPVTVNVITWPPDARIVVYPIVQPYGFPDGKQRVEAETRSPAQLELMPGEYFVVAALDDGRFHEVYRTVPESLSGFRNPQYAHTAWQPRTDGTIEWRDIRIPEADVGQGMTLFTGNPEFQMGEPGPKLGPIPQHRRFVSEFYLDPHEVTWGEYLAASNNNPPFSLLGKGIHLKDKHLPIAGIWYDDAVGYAERVGKRLPTEAEYEFAATNGGTQRFPWGDDPERITEWKFGPAGTPEFDRLNTTPPVFGLYSNVAEWTSSWASAYPPLLDYQRIEPPPFRRVEGTYIVRGGAFSVIQRKPDPQEFENGPRYRVAQDKKTIQPGLGFRCVRSLRPHLEASSLERYVRKPDE